MKSGRIESEYVKPAFLGLLAGVFLMVLQAIAPVPGLDKGIPYVPNCLTAVYESCSCFKHSDVPLKEIATLQNTAYFLRFWLIFCEQGFAYIMISVGLSLIFTRYQSIRAIACISKSLKFSISAWFVVYLAWLALILATEVRSKGLSIEELFAITLSGAGVFSFTFLTIGSLFLLGALTINMMTWKPRS